MERLCPRCCIGCHEKAVICHSCGFVFSKLKRVWHKVINITSIVSLFIGLLLVVINQGSKLLIELKPTEFTSLGIKSAVGTNRFITDNYALAIKSGTGVLLERLTFMGSDDLSKSLKVSIIHGRSYKALDVASMKLNPTAIHMSYRPVPIEMISMLLNNGIEETQISDLFKVRPKSRESKISKKYPWATIAGMVKVDYIEPQRDPTKRLSKTFVAPVLLWARKADNLRQRLAGEHYCDVDINSIIQKYNEIIDQYESGY